MIEKIYIGSKITGLTPAQYRKNFRLEFLNKYKLTSPPPKLTLRVGGDKTTCKERVLYILPLDLGVNGVYFFSLKNNGYYSLQVIL